MIEWILLIILLFVIGGSAFFYVKNNDSTPPPIPAAPAETIIPTYVPAPTPTVNPFHEKWNSILLAKRVQKRQVRTTTSIGYDMTTGEETVGQTISRVETSIYVYENPAPDTNERILAVAQRPHFHEGVFYMEKMVPIPLRPKGDSLIGVADEGRPVELKIINYLVCEMIYNNGNPIKYTRL
jgi:hypothetical protein